MVVVDLGGTVGVESGAVGTVDAEVLEGLEVAEDWEDFGCEV